MRSVRARVAVAFQALGGRCIMTARRTGTVSAAALVALAAAVGIAHAVAPRWVARAGLDVWNLPGLHADVRAAEAEAAAARQAEENLARQIEAADRVCARVAEGSLTLAGAADELGPLLRDRVGFQTTCAVHYKAPTFRHGAARYAIRKVLAGLEGNPARHAAAAERLEAEYAALR
jgi:hypothetical protein